MVNLTGRQLNIVTPWKSGPLLGRDIIVQDVNTGEAIDNVSRVVITLDVDNGINETEITYYESDGTSV